MICRVVGKMLSDKELRRNGNYWAMKAKAWLTETREDHPEELTKAYKWFDKVRLRESLKQAWREFRAIQRKKRTCSHCGTTAPFSSRAFPYCGGCRHSDVARKDRPRYCSEECQRAHWLAGHMNECPCTG